MDKKVHELLNDQINKELYSAYLYLDFSNYFKAKGLDGFANWYMIQAQEERDHAMLFYTYLQNENQEVTLEAIAKPDKKLYLEIVEKLAKRYAIEMGKAELFERAEAFALKKGNRSARCAEQFIESLL